MKNNRLFSKFAVAVLLATMIIQMAIIPTMPAQAQDPSDWYMTVNGVLTSDTYSLFPYYEESVDIGFSKFGEMIAYDWDSEVGVGLQYHGFESVGTNDQRFIVEDNDDVFANEQVPITDWMNGWFIDIKYTTAAGDPREIWAFAQFSDSKAAGKDWIVMPELLDPTDPARPLWQEHRPYANPDADKYVPALGTAYKGGRKTNGVAETWPIEVLYDGPRKFIALTRTRISDGETPLVEVHITVIFDKAEKYVILLKDVKDLYVKSPLNIQFGNRGEWDLLPNSYVHFFTDEPVQWWDLNGDGNLDEWERAKSHEFYRDFMVDMKYPKKWWQDVDESQIPYEWDGQPFDPWDEGWFETQNTTFTDLWHVDQNIKDHGYAVCQIIHTDYEHVGAHAVWPHPEFWTVQNRINIAGDEISLMLTPLSRLLEWRRWLVDDDPVSPGFPEGELPDRENIWIKIDDMIWPRAEPSIPFVIYEHDFELNYGITDQYRIVSAYMIADLHDGDDADIGPGHANVIDREIRYMLDEIFNSWDLYKAMHKETKRWVEYFDIDDFYKDEWGMLRCIDLPWTQEPEVGLVIPSVPVYLAPHPYENRLKEWDEYCSFSERVELDEDGDGTFELVLTPSDVLNVNWGTGRVRDPLDMWKSDPYFYWIDRPTGVICVYKEDGSGYIDDLWKLGTSSIIKVLWSSYHTQTVGETWGMLMEDDIIMDNAIYDMEHWWKTKDWGEKEFPLHHDVIKGTQEVFIVEQSPERIISWDFTGDTLNPVNDEVLASAGTHSSVMVDGNRFVQSDTVSDVKVDGVVLTKDVDYYVTYCYDEPGPVPPYDGYAVIDFVDAQTATTDITADYSYWTNTASLDITDWIEPCKELSAKVWVPWACGAGWMEWKWHINHTDKRIPFNLSFPMPVNFTKKVWHHSEKAIEDGYYVVCDDGITLQYPLEECEWLWVRYEAWETGDDEEYLLHAAPYEENGWEGWGDDEIEGVITGADYKDNFGFKEYINTYFPLPTTPDDNDPMGGASKLGFNTVTVTNTVKMEKIIQIGPEPAGDYVTIVDAINDIVEPGVDGKILIDVKGPFGSWVETIEDEDYEVQLWEIDWLEKTDEKERGNYVIHETETCDELVLDQAMEYYTELKIVYEVVSGRYEWTVVGKDAASVDSIGAALITAAIKNKRMEIGIGGLDMAETELANQIPWVMRKFGVGWARTDYAYDYPDDMRTALKNDWCTTWPISSSNMISVGGPLANVLSEYANDFTQAIYGDPRFSGSRWLGKVVGYTCWASCFGRSFPPDDPHIYSSEDDNNRYGYAVIGTAKDKNGTVILTVWGHFGRDTYYASHWFETHKFKLQHINQHVTSLILRIDYKKPDHPTFKVLEALGTISEKPPHQDNPPA